ncbi:Cof-type HAD-IIB family hydrolase [Streptococcus ovis]|uniref:Cof-type HAD-IIB family hydrolase n=1 Tax=Streptococcus ovis TaxID=82806 RepID=UPI0003744026|nr:Cof-type HAD-IIB family hydrolase [Streptococcus ovis]
MIRLIGFDMDGTFLNSQNNYDRAHFARLFPLLKEKGIRLVAISGNQYQQIRSFFEGYLDDIVIVSEIGAQIFEKGQRIDCHSFDRTVVENILHLFAEKDLLARCSVAGLEALYFEEEADSDFKNIIKKHNYAWREIPSLLDLPDDQFTILTLDVPGQDIPTLVADINHLGQGQVKAVSSGFHFIDIVLPDVNKGTALAYLGEKWGINPDEMMVFGDSDNDLEMLEYAAHSYAMEGSPISVLSAAKFLAPSNDASGVFQIIEQLLREEQ